MLNPSRYMKKISYIFLLLSFFCFILFIPAARLIIVSFAERFLVHRQLNTGYWLRILLFYDIIFVVSFLILFFLSFFYEKIENDIEKSNIIFVVVIFYSFFISNARFLLNRNFIGYANAWEFSDFTDAIHGYGQVRNLYSTNYPPLAVIFFKLLFRFVPLDAGHTYAENYCLSIYILFTTLASFLLIQKLLKNIKYRELYSFSIIVCSGPFLFTFQRMNIVTLALIFTMFFLVNYNSENKFLKEIALFSLALGANIKYYPAIFGFILIKEKKWKDGIRCMIYGIALFLLPMVIEKILFVPEPVVQALADPVSQVSNSHGASIFSGIMGFLKARSSLRGLSLSSMVHNLLAFFHCTNFFVNSVIANICLVVYILLSFFCFFVTQKKYQAYLFLALMCVFVPPLSYWYSLIFLVIPLTQFFSERKNNFCDNFIFLLFILIFAFAVDFIKILQPHSGWHIVLLFLFAAIDCLVCFFRNGGFKFFHADCSNSRGSLVR